MPVGRHGHADPAHSAKQLRRHYANRERLLGAVGLRAGEFAAWTMKPEIAGDIRLGCGLSVRPGPVSVRRTTAALVLLVLFVALLLAVELHSPVFRADQNVGQWTKSHRADGLLAAARLVTDVLAPPVEGAVLLLAGLMLVLASSVVAATARRRPHPGRAHGACGGVQGGGRSAEPGQPAAPDSQRQLPLRAHGQPARVRWRAAAPHRVAPVPRRLVRTGGTDRNVPGLRALPLRVRRGGQHAARVGHAAVARATTPIVSRTAG